MEAQQNFNRVAMECIRYLLSADEAQLEEAIEKDPDLADDLRAEMKELNSWGTAIMMEDLENAYEATLSE